MAPTLNIILTGSLSLLLSMNIFSQSLGVGAGINISKLNFKSDESTEFGDYRSLIGLHVALHYDLKFTDRFGIRIGIAYSSKGFGYKSGYNYSSDVDSFSTCSKSKTRLNYMQINPMLKYTLPVSERKTFYALIGPYLSMGLSGKQAEHQTYSYIDHFNPTNNINIDTSNDNEIHFGQDESGFDIINYGVTSIIGFQLNRFFVEAVYDIGINDIEINNEDEFEVRDRTFSIKFGYLFQ
tara:strand:- start:277 stop:990 length:714 start_codon:yes stop_codon:yes gene_type:complete